MKYVLKNLFFIFLSLSIPSSALAKKVKLAGINTNLEAIQLAALKERKNFLNQNPLFLKYDTYVAYGKEYTKYFIVNVQKEDYLNILAEVKRDFPSAFRASKKVKIMVKENAIPTLSPSEKIEHTFEHQDKLLDTDSILKTRKKFF